MDMITVNIKSVLQDAGFEKFEIVTVLEPAWSSDWISDLGRQKLLDYGIAPPAQRTTDFSFLTGSKPIVHCPQCTSANTEMISLFGSTACKSMYKCHDCLEPFDYFKCH
jgi:ring-1,2-phenylacetyl-CoA epoxidase subunit PaaD